MRIEREYRQLEDTEEIRIYDIKDNDLYVPMPKEFDVPEIPFENTLQNIINDIDIFIPYDDGNDFIVNRLGIGILERGHLNKSETLGRLLSKISPGFFEILKDPLKEVYQTHRTKKLRILYHTSKN